MSRLAGVVVATTRAIDADARLEAILVEEGARVRRWPTTSVDHDDCLPALRRAIRNEPGYDWLAFTSPRAVAAVVACGPIDVGAARIAAVGPTTAGALEAAGLRPTLVGRGGALELAGEMAERVDLQDARILFPAGNLAEPTLDRALAAHGARVKRIEAYRTTLATIGASDVRADLGRGVDIVTFLSPSAVRGLSEALEHRAPDALAGCGIASVGYVTADTLRDHGFGDIAVASRPTLASVADTCAALALRRRGR